MKQVILALVWSLLTTAACGQGQFVFNNRVPPEIDARFQSVVDTSTTSSIGTDYTVQLFAGTSLNRLIPLDPAFTTFRGAAGTAVAGYVVPATVTVPNVAPGETANIVLRLVGPNIPPVPFCGYFGPYAVVLGGGVIPPPNLPLGTTPLNVGFCPEPAAWMLGPLGLCLLIVFRCLASTPQFSKP